MYFTEKQLRILKFIQHFRAQRGISPTMEEIAAKVGVTKITVYDHLNQLERKGALRRERFRARSIEPLVWVGEGQGQFVLPILGARAGSSMPNGESLTLDLSAVLPLNKQCFAFRVDGDSLLNDHIRDGDYVIVERRPNPANGDLVVALADGRSTIKRYFREKSRVRLESPGGDQKPIRLKSREAQVHGVVVGLLRNFPADGKN